MRSGGNYEVATNYLPEGKEEYKFKASKAENRLPIQVLLDCPKLVDVETTEQVQEYFDCWNAGLQASESGEYQEKSLSGNDEYDEVEKE